MGALHAGHLPPLRDPPPPGGGRTAARGPANPVLLDRDRRARPARAPPPAAGSARRHACADVGARRLRPADAPDDPRGHRGARRRRNGAPSPARVARPRAAGLRPARVHAHRPSQPRPSLPCRRRGGDRADDGERPPCPPAAEPGSRPPHARRREALATDPGAPPGRRAPLPPRRLPGRRSGGAPGRPQDGRDEPAQPEPLPAEAPDPRVAGAAAAPSHRRGARQLAGRRDRAGRRRRAARAPRAHLQRGRPGRLRGPPALPRDPSSPRHRAHGARPDDPGQPHPVQGARRPPRRPGAGRRAAAARLGSPLRRPGRRRRAGAQGPGPRAGLRGTGAVARAPGRRPRAPGRQRHRHPAPPTRKASPTACSRAWRPASR